MIMQDGFGISDGFGSGSSAPAVPVAPRVISAPTITGTPQVGQTLSRTAAVFSGDTSRSDNWIVDGVSVGTGVTLLVTGEMTGKNISFRSVGINDVGSTTSDSNSLGPVIVAAPVNTVAPSITGIAQEGKTLTGADGTWSGSPTFARQWKANGVNIAGATGNTCVLSTTEIGKAITYQVIGTNAGGSTTAVSVATSAVAALPTENADATVYLNAAGISDPTRRGFYSTFFDSTADHRALLDHLFIFAAPTQTASLKNLINPSDVLVPVDDAAYNYDDPENPYLVTIGPLFTADRGWANRSAAGTSYSVLRGTVIRNNLKAQTNDLGWGGYLNTALSDPYGGTPFTYPVSGIWTSYSELQLVGNPSNQVRVRSDNNGGAQASAVWNLGGKGCVAVNSAGAGAWRASLNGAADVSMGLAGTIKAAGAASTNYFVGNGSGRYAAVWSGKAFTAAQATSFYNALQTFLVAVGAQA